MKKISALLISVSIMLLCTGCSGSSSESKQAMENYEAAIANVAVITLDSESDVLIAENAYKLLSERQQKKVTDEKVVEAREAFDRLQKLNELLPEICLKLENILKPGHGITVEDFKEDLDYVSANINLITEEQKTELGNVDRFYAAVEKYESVVKNANTFAKNYVGQFMKDNPNVIVTEVACIVNEKDGSMSFYFALKYTENSQEKAVYAHSGVNENTAVEALYSYKEYYYAEKPLNDKYNPFENGNYTLDSAEIINGAAE